MNKVMLLYPPGRMFMRGEDRCQANIEASTTVAMRACNDLGYAAAVLLQRDYEVFLRDYQTERATQADVKRDILAFEPDFILISTTNATIYEDIAQIAEIRSYCRAKFMLKGALFYAPEKAMLELLDLSLVECLIGGEIDTVIGSLADYYLRGIGEIQAIPSILYQENGMFAPTRFHAWEDRLDDIPFPARQLMNNALYVRPDTGEPMATIQTARGCPSNCVFCLTPGLSGKKVRFRSPENVFQEIAECYHKYNIRNFFFKADTFTINAQWVHALCDLIRQSDLNGKIAFAANSRVSPLSREILREMKAAGCFMIAFGFETGSAETLEKIKKGTTLEQARQARKWAKEAGIPVNAFYMIGFPWEDEGHLRETKKLIFELDAEFIELALALPYYGTELYAMCQEEGLLAGEEVLGLDYFSGRQCGTQYVSEEYLLKYRKQLLLRYYLRPSYLLKRLFYSVKNPKIFLNYVKYGLKMLRQ